MDVRAPGGGTIEWLGIDLIAPAVLDTRPASSFGEPAAFRAISSDSGIIMSSLRSR